MTSFESMTLEELYKHFVENTAVMRGSVEVLNEDLEMPEMDKISLIFDIPPFESFIASIRENKESIKKTLDIQELAITLQREAVDIQRELLKRL